MAVLLTACTDDGAEDRRQRSLYLVAGSQDYYNDDDPATRALPDGFNPYTLPDDTKIQGYLAAAGSEQPVVGLFSKDATYWSSRMQIDDDGSYFFYAFLPKEDDEIVSIVPYNGNYSNGAVLTINGISAITPDDVCVAVGVKKHADVSDNIASLDMATRLGKFDVDINADEEYLYLLLDHLFSRLKFEINIDATYNELRTIKVKKMELISVEDKRKVKTVNATVTLAATTDGSSPLSSISIEVNETGDWEQSTAIYNGTEPLVLTKEPQSIDSYYTPAEYTVPTAVNPTFILRTTYDVYDRKGNHPIRENEQAENKLAPGIMHPGQEYSYKIKVTPTYLYVLSEPDLDSPTFSIE